jgi:hypothetical protein
VMMASGKAALIRFSISLAAIAMVAAPFKCRLAKCCLGYS